MVGEGRVEPARGEEDVAGGLDLLKQFQAREHVLLRLRDSERMVEVFERLEYPRLDFALSGFRERGEERVPDRFIG